MDVTRDRQGEPMSTADLLEKIEEMEGDSEISIGEITEVIGGRAHGLVLLILSLPETIPMVGLSAILAAPILILGGVLVIKGENPPVPEWVRRRSLPRDKVQSAIRRTRPVVRWVDRVLRPRWHRLANAGRLQGGICVVMALLLAIPIPGVNILAAAAVAGVGLGILQRDGLAVAMAGGAAILALIGFGAVVAGAWGLLGG